MADIVRDNLAILAIFIYLTYLIVQHNESWCTTYSVIVDTVITNQTLGNQVVKLVRL